MENSGNPSNEKKNLNKVKSFNNPQTVKLTIESLKRKSCYVNGAVKSLDLALGRLKKSKLVNEEYRQAIGMQGTSEILMGLGNNNSSLEVIQGIDDASLMSVNFSQYELMRNLSQCNCSSEDRQSDNTCSVVNADIILKDEQLERYFRSIDMWSSNYRDGVCSSSVHIELPEN